MAHPLSNKRIAIIAGAGLVILIAVLLIQTFGKAYRDIGFDFTSYLISAEALAHGDSPYATGSVFPYIYPPFLALVLIPLTLVPYWVAVLIWYLLSVAALLYAAILLVDLVSDDMGIVSARAVAVLGCALSILMLPVIQNNLLNGQVNFLVLLFCVLFLRFHTDNRSVLSPLMLSIAIAIKLVPGILLIFLLVRRRFVEAALTLGFTALFIIAPFDLQGSDGGITTSQYFSGILGFFADGASQRSGEMFFSLIGFLSYLNPGISDILWLKLAVTLSVVSTVAAVHLYTLMGKAVSGPGTLAWIFSLYLLAILLILPMSETHHLAFLLPAILLVSLRTSFQVGLSRADRWVHPGVFFVLFWLGKSDKSGPFFFLSVVWLAGVVLWYLVSRQRDQADESVAVPAA